MFYILYCITRIASCYPQVFHNAKRKSVRHLSSDFVLWSFVSPLFILIHIALLRWDPIARFQYSLRYTLQPIPSTDFVSSEGGAPNHLPGASLIEFIIYLHAAFIWGWIVLRTQMNRKYVHTINQEIQDVSLLSQVLLYGSIAFIGVIFIAASWHLPHGNPNGIWGFKWLDVVYLFYTVGEAAAWFRFLPQIPINFQGRDTLGISPNLLYIEAVGLLLLWASQIIKALRYHRWMQLALPNSIFFLLVFKTLIISKLLHQMWFVYRKNNLKILASLPRPITSSPASVLDDGKLSLFDKSVLRVSRTLQGGLRLLTSFRRGYQPNKPKSEAEEGLLEENELADLSRNGTKDA